MRVAKKCIKNLYATGFFDDVRVETWATKCCSPWWSAHHQQHQHHRRENAAKQRDSAKLQFFRLGRSQSFNQATLNQAVAGLKQEYISRGKQSVQITPEVTRLARNRVAIDIKIDEGASTKITDIQFEGQRALFRPQIAQPNVAERRRHVDLAYQKQSV